MPIRRQVMTACLIASLGACELACKSSDMQSASRRNSESILDGGRQFDAVKDPPFNVETRYAAGQLAEAQGTMPRAIEQYNEALKIDPKHAQSLFRLGIVYAQTKQYDNAIEVWKRYVDVTKGSPVAYSNLGLCYELAGKIQEAESAFKVGIVNAPTNEACRVNYGLMLARQSRIEEALEQLQAVLAPAAAHYNIGSVFEQQGRLPEARQQYTIALELEPGFTDARARLARLTKASAMVP